MLIQAVDLAARYSASVTIDETGQVIDQFDSWRVTRQQFVSKLVEPFSDVDDYSEVPLVLGVEDLPHGVKFMSLIKNVCKLQGVIEEHMSWTPYLDRMMYVPPILWQTEIPGIWRKGTKAPLDVARALYDYEPPDLGMNELRGADRTTARKVQTDYAAAYCIARWLLDQYKQRGVFDREDKYKTSRVKAS